MYDSSFSIASYSVILSKPESKSQFRFPNYLNSTRKNGFLIKGGIPVSLTNNVLTFRDSNRSFKIDGDLLETMVNFDFNVSNSNPQDRKLIYDFGKEKIFYIRQQGKKSNRDKSMIKILKSRAINASKNSAIALSSDPDEICHRLKYLLQEKQADSNSDIINEEIITIFDKLLEQKCMSKKQQKQFLIKCNLLHE